MNELGCSPLIRRTLPFRNCSEQSLTLRLEPWADEFVILPNDELVIVFVGPPDGEPSFNLGLGWIEAYGWPGCEAFVFRDGQRIGSSSTVLEIIQQEAQIFYDVIRRKSKFDDTGLWSLAEAVQNKLEDDFSAYGDKQGCKLAAFWAAEIAYHLFHDLKATGSAANFVWRVCSRILQCRGFTLPDPDGSWLLELLKTGNSNRLAKTFARHAFPICPVTETTSGGTGRRLRAKSGRARRRPERL